MSNYRRKSKPKTEHIKKGFTVFQKTIATLASILGLITASITIMNALDKNKDHKQPLSRKFKRKLPLNPMHLHKVSLIIKKQLKKKKFKHLARRKIQNQMTILRKMSNLILHQILQLLKQELALITEHPKHCSTPTVTSLVFLFASFSFHFYHKKTRN